LRKRIFLSGGIALVALIRAGISFYSSMQTAQPEKVNMMIGGGYQLKQLFFPKQHSATHQSVYR
jgi:hypothetical protein